MEEKDLIIGHTRKWISDVVVGCNFCPFAARELKRNSIQYDIVISNTINDILQVLLNAMRRLDHDPGIETLFIIMPDSFLYFDRYLQLVTAAEKLLAKESYEGIYQVAGFHPQYIFAGSTEDDAANYTNRSPYPMLHLLREDSVSRAIDSHPDTEGIPRQNILFARSKGLAYMQTLKNNALNDAGSGQKK